MTTRRLTYVKLTPTQFRAGLIACGLIDDKGGADVHAFAVLFGMNPSRAERWLKQPADGGEDIPVWITTIISYLIEHGCELAYQTATEIIQSDALHPDLGRFPYAETKRLPADFAAGVHNVWEKRRELTAQRAQRMADMIANDIEAEVEIELRNDRKRAINV